MKGPTTLHFLMIAAVSLLFALAGLYLMANFSRVLKNIRSELLRKNIVAWLIIFCISIALVPMTGGFFYLVEKYGWGWAICSQFISTTLCTLIIFNLTRFVAENKKLKKLSFAAHNLLVVLTLIVTTLAINIPLSHWLYADEQTSYSKYVIVSSIYIAGATGLVYAVINYMDLETKRKFHDKELELSLLRELKAKAELDALHSKINPHFLYNALNSIADLSVTDGKKARQMTIALADLFRYSINYSNNNFSTVKDEVEMANVYLQIEKIRFEDKLSYNLNIEEGLNQYLVPRFVLQPLVENAVKHGLKATGKLTEIRLQVEKTKTGLVMRIADTGPDFPEQLNPGYGVKSVYDKLDLLFPGNYEIHYTNQPVKQVSIFINKLVKDESTV